jgi:hypothetical protein
VNDYDIRPIIPGDAARPDREAARLEALLELAAERRRNGDHAQDDTVRFAAESQARLVHVTMVPHELGRVLQGAAVTVRADDGTDVVVRIPTADELGDQIRAAQAGTGMEGNLPHRARLEELRRPLTTLGW